MVVRFALALPLPLVVLAAGGCFTAGSGRDECGGDGDCSGGDECTRTGECIEGGTAIRVVVEWTIAGAPPSEASCAPFAELGVLFYEGEREDASYDPIPCAIARTVYDKMPPRLTRLELYGFDEGGGIIDSGGGSLESSGETVVAVDLEP